MKNTSLMFFLLVIVLASPALLFASDNLLNDITSGLNDIKTNSVNWGSGALQIGSSVASSVYNAGASTVGFAVGGIKSTTGFAVGGLTGNPALGNQVSTSNWGQTIGSNLLGINQPLFGASVNGSAVNDLKSFNNNWSTTKTDTQSLTGWSDNTSFSKSGKNAMDLAINPQGKIK